MTTAGTPPKPTAFADACRFIETLFAPGDVVLFRPIETWTEGDGKQSRTDYTGTDHVRLGLKGPEGQFVHFTQLLNGAIDRQVKRSDITLANIFFGVCPRFKGRGLYDKKWQIRTVRALWADVDDTNDLNDLAGRCDDAELSQPSLITSTGRGLQCYWLLDQPYLIDDVGDPRPVHIEWTELQGKRKPREYYTELGSDEELWLDVLSNVPDLSPKAQYIEDILSGIAKLIGGDHTTDLSRILRLPDTLNRKNQRNGTDPLRCRLVKFDPDLRRELQESFDFVLQHSPAKAERQKVAAVELPEVKDFTQIDPAYRQQFAELVRKSSSAPQGERSEADFAVLAYSIEHGFDKSNVWAHVCRGGKFSERGEKYFEFTWTKAEQRVKESILAGTFSPNGKPKDDLPSIISIGQLIDTAGPMRPVVIDGLLRRGETANIIADPKRGKSWLTYGITLSVVTGRDWLDYFPVTTGGVLLIDNELHPETISSRIQTVADAMRIPAEQYRGRFDVLPLRGRLRSIVDIEPLVQSIEPGKYLAVIIDAFYRMFPEKISENDNAQVASIYNRIDQYANHTQAAWLLIHHATKGNQTEKNVTDVGAGAGSQARATDCHLILRPHQDEGQVVLEAAVRSFPPVEPVVLRWEYPLWLSATDADPRKLRQPTTTRQLNQQVADEEGIGKIIAALFEHKSGTAGKIRGWTGLSRDRCQRLLDGLQYTGRLIRADTTIRGNECGEYRLADPPERDVVGLTDNVDRQRDNVP